MRILPSKTLPPSKPIIRRHTPQRGQYGVYRPCLRWDFGFICPFCLIHEVDYTRLGYSEGFGLTSVEHLIPQSTDDTLKHVYDNCIYCCRFCNRARSNRPVVDDTGRMLLNPTSVGWAKHFQFVGDTCLPVAGDLDAEYTHEAYDIDDRRKVAFRRIRRELYDRHLNFLQSRPLSRVNMLLQLAAMPERTLEEIESLIKTARDLRREVNSALDDLSSYRAIPPDAPQTCRCGSTVSHSLPEEFDQQQIDVPALQ